MKAKLILIMITIGFNALAQNCPCVKTAVIGINAKAKIISNNQVIAMADVEITLGEIIDLKAIEATGAISWFENGIKLSSTYVSPTETTEYAVKSSLDLCPDAFDKVIVVVNKTRELENTVSVFPNPTNDIISVFSKRKQIKSLTVIDLNEKVIYKRTCSGTDNIETINIDFLNSGHYILKIKLTDNSEESRKIIKT